MRSRLLQAGVAGLNYCVVAKWSHRRQDISFNVGFATKTAELSHQVDNNSGNFESTSYKMEHDNERAC